MNADQLYKRLMDRDDIKDIPIEYVVKVCLSVVEEIPEVLKGENEYESLYEL